jgi:hypothetical protein
MEEKKFSSVNHMYNLCLTAQLTESYIQFGLIRLYTITVWFGFFEPLLWFSSIRFFDETKPWIVLLIVMFCWQKIYIIRVVVYSTLFAHLGVFDQKNWWFWNALSNRHLENLELDLSCKRSNRNAFFLFIEKCIPLVVIISLDFQ